MDQDFMKAAIKKAICAEREACAKIAESYEQDENCIMGRGDFWAEKIAAAIRQRSVPSSR